MVTDVNDRYDIVWQEGYDAYWESADATLFDCPYDLGVATEFDDAMVWRDGFMTAKGDDERNFDEG